GHVIHSILIDPGDSQHIYFAIRPGVWESLNGGTTFHPLGNLGDNPTVDRLERVGRTLYAGITGRGVFSWNPTLATWEPVGRRLPTSFNGSFVPDPQIPGRLWAGTYGAGLFSLEP
ncbi:MAG TPA: hypothetical protein VN851_19980, partial [Thermoanaerobaculia bacterium]|nr:hypothetical protein [Thermoanaerobaculia bacterium]